MKTLIREAKLLDGSIVDIGVYNGKIVAIDSKLDDTKYHEIVNLNQEYYVSAGWIDMHTHCFDKFDLYSDNPDLIGYKQGVTTVVDAGTAGSNDIEELYMHANECKTHVFSLLNISKIGLLRQDELSDLNNVDEQLIKRSIDKYRGFIIGLKVRQSKTTVGNTGVKGLELAKYLSIKYKLPLMIHIGTNPPKLEECLEQLDENDIVTHIFNGKENGILTDTKQIKKDVLSAKERGVKFDLGHGTDSFNFDVAKIALENHLKVDTISSDIYSKNRIQGPVYSLATTMTKMMAIGYTLNEVIEMVTDNPANILKLECKGKIEVGYDADLTFFKVVACDEELIDSQQNIQKVKKMICPFAVFINDEYIQIK